MKTNFVRNTISWFRSFMVGNRDDPRLVKGNCLIKTTSNAVAFFLIEEVNQDGTVNLRCGLDGKGSILKNEKPDKYIVAEYSDGKLLLD